MPIEFEEVEVTKRVCPYCQYTWIPRVESPLRCPVCRRLLIKVKGRR